MPGVVIELDPHKLRSNGKPLYADGKPRYRARWYDAHARGKPVYKVCRTKTLARSWLARMDADAKYDLDHPAPLVNQTLTFAQLVESWRGTRLVGLAPRTRMRYEGLLKNYLLPEWGDRILATITREECPRFFLGLIAAGKTPGTVRKAQVCASSVWGEALDNGHALNNPAARLRLPTPPERDMVILTPREIRALADAIHPHFKTLIYVACYSGLRASELHALRRQDVDPTTGALHVRQALKSIDPPVFGAPKSKRSRRVVTVPTFVHNLLRARLENVADDPDALVFTSTTGGIIRQELWRKRYFHPAVKQALPHKLAFRPHDMRHTAASIAIASGFDLLQVRDRLGHASTKTTEIYSHLFPGHDAPLLAALDAAHEASAQPEPAQPHLQVVS